MKYPKQQEFMKYLSQEKFVEYTNRHPTDSSLTDLEKSDWIESKIKSPDYFMIPKLNFPPLVNADKLEISKE